MPSSEGYLTVEYQAFSAGEYGKIGGAKAPPGSFHATNMIVNTEGLLVPRAGLADITPASMPTGKIWGLTSTDTPTKDGLMIIGNTVYLFDLFTPSTAPTSIGTLGVTPTAPISIKRDASNRIFAIPGDHAYVVDPIAATLTKLTTSPGGYDVETYDSQLVIASGDTSNELFASKPGDFTDWSEGRFIDVGDNWQITALFEQQNTLGVLKRRGHHTVSGVVGDPNTQFVRKLATVMGPLYPQHAALDDSDVIWFWPFTRDDIGIFDGTAVKFTGHIGAPNNQNKDPFPPVVPMIRGLAAIKGDLTATSLAAVQAGTDQFMALQHNGIWTYHTFGATVSGMVVHDPELERIVITDGGGTGVAGKIFTTWPGLNRPVLSGDTLVRFGDDSDTPLSASVTFPQYWVAPYRRYPVPSIRIRQIVVDFKKYSTGASANNHFDVIATQLGRPGVDPVPHTFANPFDEAPAGGTDGTWSRKALNWGVELSGGFEISLTNIVGVAIRAVTVHFEFDSKRPSA